MFNIPTHLNLAGKNVAFTLAEVLITLGIVGVVAALTIPSLISRYEKKVIVNQLKETSSIIQQAMKLYMTDMGTTDLKNTPLYKNSGELKKVMYKYFKVINDCDGKYYVEGKYNCFSKAYKDLDGSQFSILPYFGCDFTASLANGASVCVDVNTDPNLKYILAFEVDLNGVKGPNTYSKDYHKIYVSSNGIIYDDSYEKGARPEDIRGFNCLTGSLGQIMHDSWEINYY